MTVQMTRRAATSAVLVLSVLMTMVGLGTHRGRAATLAITAADLTAAAVDSPTRSAALIATIDAYVDEGAADTNFGSGDMVVRSSSLDNQRLFFQFDVSSIPSTATVLEATVKLYMSAAPAVSRTYSVHRVTASWAEDTITWNAPPTVHTSATSSTSSGTTSGVMLSWDVAADVATFVAGTNTNYGWRLVDSAENSASSPQATFASREIATSSQRPLLEVHYVLA